MILLYMASLFLLISTLTKKKLDAYFYSAVITVGTIYFLNELLSLGNHLNRNNLLAIYGVLFLFISLLVYLRRKRLDFFTIKELSVNFKQIKRNKWLMSLIVFLSLVFLGGLIVIPHTIDSMTYGMTRIAYWEQNASVAHYATNDVRAVSTPPLSEFINLQLYLLHNQSDRLFTLIQNLSFITNTVLVAAICKKLRLSERSTAIGILLYVTMPIAFAEAFTTQVEQFATFWLLVFVYYLMDFIDEEFCFTFSKPVFAKVALLAACIGFGYLTKSSVMFGMLVFALWLLICVIKRKEKIKIVMPLVLLAAIEIVCILFPELYRNIITFHAFTAPSVGAKHMVDTLNPLYILLNGLKNLSVNVPNMYFPWMGKVIVHGLYWLAAIWGINLDDPSIAHDGIAFMLYEPRIYECDAAVNPILLFFSFAVCLWLIMNWIRRKEFFKYTAYCIATILSFLLFCFSLKYEWYGVRYMLSYFALACPMVAFMFDKMEIRKKNSSRTLVTILVFMSLIELSGMTLYHGERIVRHAFAKDSIEGYFEFRENDEQAYRDFADYLNQQEYDELGIYFAWKAGEYPIWKMLQSNVRIEAVNVENETSMYADESFIPDFIVVKDIDGSAIENYKENHYCLERVFDQKLYLYRRQ